MTNNGARGKGWKHDADRNRERDLSIHHLLGASHGHGTPGEWLAMQQWVTEAWNQGPTESCVGHADGRAVHVRCAAMATPIAKPSVTAIYVGALAIEREQSGRSPLTPLVDEGCTPALAIAGMERFGIPLDSEWPPGGFDANRVVEEGPELLAELEKAGAFRLTGWYQIGTTDMATRLAAICQAVSQNYPVPFGTQVDGAFEDFHGTDAVGAPDKSRLVGGHMMCVVGFRANGDFLVVNSWGPGWGDHGMFWAKPEFLANPLADDFSVITINPNAPAPKGPEAEVAK